MRKIKIKKILIVLSLVLISFTYIPRSEAAAPRLYMSPASLTKQVGSVFTASVYYSSTQKVNTFAASVNAPGNILKVTGASSGGSKCTLFVQQPTVVGNTTSFQCGTPNGISGSGKIISISFRAVGVGTASVTINNAKILANNGLGTNVISGTSPGIYKIVAPPPPLPTATAAPTVTSSSHPDQNKWYKERNVSLSWNRQSGVTGYSYIIDQNPGTIPPESVNTNDTSFKVLKGDGVWYFHLRAKGTNGWSSTTDYRIQIDITAPTNLVIVSDPKENIDRRPMISFNATDAGSGIDHYRIQLDKTGFNTVKSPYIPSIITSGYHVFDVKAYDKAGNWAEGKLPLTVIDIPIPKITSPKNNTIFRLAEHLEVSGTAQPGLTVNIYLDGLKITQEGVKVDESGNYKYTYEGLVFPGKHELFAMAVKDGIYSKSSEKIKFRVDPSAVSIWGFIIPSYIAFIILLFIIGLLILIVALMFIYIRRKIFALLKRVRKEEENVKRDIQAEYAEMEREVREKVESRKGIGITTEEGSRLVADIDQEILESEKRLFGRVDQNRLKEEVKPGVVDNTRHKLIDILEKPEEREALEEVTKPKDYIDGRYHGKTRNEDFLDDLDK